MKKLKLSLSIAMMCLCVAVLCMGILAASSANYQINGNISYNMIDGVARINTRVYKVAGDPASESDLQTAVTGTFLTTSSFAVIEANQSPIYAQTYQNKETLEYTDTPTTKDYDINVVYGANNDADAYYTYYVVIQIYNQTETSGYVLNASITDTDGTEIVSTDSSYVATNTSVSNIAQDTFSNIVIGISAQTIAKAQALTNSTESFAYKLSVTYEEAPLPTFNELLATYSDASGNSYWGVKLGQVSADTNADSLKWRYVGDYSTSTDGTETFNRYEKYTSTKPTVGSGSVFVQETALTNNSVAWGSLGTTNYFDSTCSISASLENGELFNLNEKETELLDSGSIEQRVLPTIWWSYAPSSTTSKKSDFPEPGSDGFNYPWYNLGLYSSSQTYRFWLMDVYELYLFFGLTTAGRDYFTVYDSVGDTHDDLVWCPSDLGVSFWLRNPCRWLYEPDTSAIMGHEVTVVRCNGSFIGIDASATCCGVRAAFQLA